MRSLSLEKIYSLQSSKGKTEAESETNSYFWSLRMMSMKRWSYDWRIIGVEIGLDMNTSTPCTRNKGYLGAIAWACCWLVHLPLSLHAYVEGHAPVPCLVPCVTPCVHCCTPLNVASSIWGHVTSQSPCAILMPNPCTRSPFCLTGVICRIRFPSVMFDPALLRGAVGILV